MTGILGKNPSSPKGGRTCDLPFISPDVLPLSCGNLVGAGPLTRFMWQTSSKLQTNLNVLVYFKIGIGRFSQGLFLSLNSDFITNVCFFQFRVDKLIWPP